MQRRITRSPRRDLIGGRKPVRPAVQRARGTVLIQQTYNGRAQSANAVACLYQKGFVYKLDTRRAYHELRESKLAKISIYAGRVIYLRTAQDLWPKKVVTSKPQKQQETMSAPEQIVDEVVHMLNTRGQGDYIGEAISQLQHSLQAAHLAAVSHAQDKVVIAALLHDIGHFLPLQEASRLAGEIKDMHNEADNTSVGRIGHERIGELYLLHKGFSPDIAALVGSHVAGEALSVRCRACLP